MFKSIEINVTKKHLISDTAYIKIIYFMFKMSQKVV